MDEFLVLAIGVNGELYAWARNYQNQLGIDVGGDQSVQVQVPKLEGVTAASDISSPRPSRNRMIGSQQLRLWQQETNRVPGTIRHEFSSKRPASL